MKRFIFATQTEILFLALSVSLRLTATDIDNSLRAIPAYNPSDGLTIQLPPRPGIGYVVEASSDCQNWAEMFRGISGTNLMSCNDVMSTIFPRRFYRVFAIQAPPNDNFSQSISLAGSEASAMGFNINGTSEAGEPEHASLESGHNSVWWSWMAPADGPVFVTTIGTYFDTLIAVYTGDTVSNLNVVAKKDFHTREVMFRANAGTTYRIAVAGRGDEYGIVKLYLKQDSSLSTSSLASLGGYVIVLTDHDYPDVPKIQINFGDNGTNWIQTSMGETTSSGTIRSNLVAGPTTVLSLNSISSDATNIVDFTFTFQSNNTGDYQYTVNGQPGRAGRFLKLKSSQNQLAVPSLAGLHLIGTRDWTTTGTSGQSHHYTFSPNNAYHDTDTDEQAAGVYSYAANGSSALLVLDYKGPSWFVGDHHELQLTFTSSTEGTFTSQYLRNDGTKIEILGSFTLGDE